MSKPIRLIGLSGYARSGKDTAAKGLTELEGGIRWARVAFADSLKDSAFRLNPDIYSPQLDDTQQLRALLQRYGTWEGLKDEPSWDGPVRHFLQRYGTELRVLRPNIWIKDLAERVKIYQGYGICVVIPDVRYANEAEWVRSRRGVIVRIERTGVGPFNTHASERIGFRPDYTVVNDWSTHALQKTIRLLVEGDE